MKLLTFRHVLLINLSVVEKMEKVEERRMESEGRNILIWRVVFRLWLF